MPTSTLPRIAYFFENRGGGHIGYRSKNSREKTHKNECPPQRSDGHFLSKYVKSMSSGKLTTDYVAHIDKKKRGRVPCVYWGSASFVLYRSDKIRTCDLCLPNGYLFFFCVSLTFSETPSQSVFGRFFFVVYFLIFSLCMSKSMSKVCQKSSDLNL